MENDPAIGIDIGGTLAKLVIYVPHSKRNGAFAKYFANKETLREKGQVQAVLEEDLSISLPSGDIYFIKFLSNDVETFLKSHDLRNICAEVASRSLFATGGGAHKYGRLLTKHSGLKLAHQNELDSLVIGLRAMLNTSDGCFTLANAKFGGDIGPAREKLVTLPLIIHPNQRVIVVNIGTGVSILSLKERTYQRVGGSSLGGSTFLGLVALLTGVDRFDEALDLAANGDSRQVDMLVKDIYGEPGTDEDNEEHEAGSSNTPFSGRKLLFKTLRPSTLASSFGKMIHKKARQNVKKEDLALSTLVMCSMNLAAIAHAYAQTVRAKHIIFTGNFLATSKGLTSPNSKKNAESIHMDASKKLSLHKRNTISMRVLSYAVSFWSQNKTNAVFMKHEGCLGALGALLQGTGLHIEIDKEVEARL